MPVAIGTRHNSETKVVRFICWPVQAQDCAAADGRTRCTFLIANETLWKSFEPELQ